MLKVTIDIQIRDLDQTVIGNPAQDLVRLGLSLATAARSSDLSGVTHRKDAGKHAGKDTSRLSKRIRRLRIFQQNRPVSIKVAHAPLFEPIMETVGQDRIEDVNRPSRWRAVLAASER